MSTTVEERAFSESDKPTGEIVLVTPVRAMWTSVDVDRCRYDLGDPEVAVATETWPPATPLVSTSNATLRGAPFEAGGLKTSCLDLKDVRLLLTLTLECVETAQGVLTTLGLVPSNLSM